jgi:hemolysin activation/secretion protein
LRYAKFLVWLFCAWGPLGPLLAQVAVDPQQQLENQQLLDIQRRQAQRQQEDTTAPTVHTAPATLQTKRPPVDGEYPCTRPQHIRLIGPSSADFDWVRGEFEPFIGKCLGSGSLQALIANLNDALQANGFITSRVQLDDMPFQSDALHIRLMAGRIGRLRITMPLDLHDKNSPPKEIGRDDQEPMAWLYRTLNMAMPTHEGKILNVRDLDHGAENIQRLGHQLSQFIVPQSEATAEQDAVHDIVMIWLISQPVWQANVQLDNASGVAFGRTNMNGRLSLQNLMGMADQWDISASGNVEAPNAYRKQQSSYLRFSVPLGYHRFNWVESKGQSALGVQGTTVTFTHHRQSTGTQLEWWWTIFRDGHYKVATQLAWERQSGISQINDVELTSLRRHARSRTVGLSVDWTGPGHQWHQEVVLTDTRRRPKADDEFNFEGESSTALSRRWTGQWTSAIQVGAYPGSYSFEWDLLSTRNPTPLSPQISLGGQYSVRGFTSDLSMSASDGALIRQEWQLYQLPKWLLPCEACGPSFVVMPYVALDVGKVWGSTVANHVPAGQRWTAGAALGLRASWATCSLDIAIATPLHGLHIEGQARPKFVPYLTLNIQI